MRPRYRFLFTGFSRKNSDEKAHLVSKIQGLGGIYYETEHFKINCTHVVCARLCRSEKFLCACAAGKWIVTPEYIINSYQAKMWLREEDYEWRISDLPPNANDALIDLCRAPKRSRQFVSWQKGKGQFYGKNFLLFVHETENREVYKQILVAGGAKVITKTPPNFDFSLLLQTANIQYVLVSENKSCLRPIFMLNILCISTDYIRNFLLKKSPPEARDFDITSYVPNSDAYYNVGLATSPIKQIPIQPPANSNFRRTRSAVNYSGIFLSKLVPIVVRENLSIMNVRNTRGGAKNSFKKDDIQIDLMKEKSQSTILNYFAVSKEEQTVSVLEANPIPSVRTCNNSFELSRKRKSATDINPAKRRILAPISNKSEKLTAESKTSEVKPEIDENTKYLLQKIWEVQKSCALNEKQTFKKHWEQKVIGVKEIDGVREYPMSCILECCSVPDNWHITLSNFGRLINLHYFLPVSIVRKIIDSFLLNGPNQTAASQAYTLLTQILIKLPPINFTLRKWYCNILENNSLFGCWSFIDSIIRCSLNSQSKAQHSRMLFLHFLELLLEKDFAFFIQRCNDVKKEIKSTQNQPIIVRIIWGTKNDLSLNTACSDLLKHFVTSISNGSSHKSISSLQKLTMLMLESSRLSEVDEGVVNEIPYNATSLVKKLVEHILAEKLPMDSLLTLLETMELSWSRLLVAQMYLDATSHPIFNTNEEIYCGLSLKKIVNFYMKLIPGQKTESQQSTGNLLQSPAKDIQNQVNKSSKINHRNAKGETRLHTACIHNQIEIVKNLLLHPDININAADNAGWTPLHEACNNGNIECVRLLLDFSKSKMKFPPIQLMAKNMDNITPLHDAVVNNHIEVAKLLLERGGQVLLHQIDKLNRLPIDLAKSDDMKSLLLNFTEVDSNENVEQSIVIPTIDDVEIEKYVVLVYNLLHDYLEVNTTKKIYVKLEKSHLICKMDSNVLNQLNFRDQISFQDIEIYKNLGQYVTAFSTHVKTLMAQPKEILSLDLLRFILFQVNESF